MKKITLLLAFMLAAVTGSYAQVSAYTFSQNTSGTYTPLVGATNLATQTTASGTSNNALDDVNYTLALPFNFTFDGVAYTSGSNIFVNTNGFVSFGASAPSSSTYGPIGSTNVYAGAISGYGLDCNGGYAVIGNATSGSPVLTVTTGNTAQFPVGALVSGTGIPAATTVLSTTATTITLSANSTSTGTVRTYHVATGVISYLTSGVTPNQQLVIQYTNMRPYNTTANVLSYQIVLHETTNVVDVVYGSSLGSTTATTSQIGLRGATNANYNNRASATSWSATTAGGTNTASVTFSNTVLPTSGLTFTWTPPNPCTGTPVAGTVLPALQNLCPGLTPSNLVASGFSSGVTGITFQWQESDDNGIGDAWANAVGGSGATTSTYTPPAFAGATIYYRLNVTCTASVSSSQTASVIVAPPGNPATQVTALSAIPNTTSAVLNWTNGNGGRRVVYLSDSATFTDPVNGNAAALVANSVYAGSGQQIIFDGTAATTTVTGLLPTTTYYVKVYEYLRCGAGPYDFYYNVSTGTNILTLTTIAPPANDDCSGAIALPVGGVFADQDIVGSNIGAATVTGLTYACQANRKDDVWYSVVVPASGSITIETDTTTGTTMTDSVLSVFSGTCGALTEVSCDDDTGNGNFSKISLTGRTPGETLYVGVWAYTLSGGGDGQFAISAYDASLTAATFDINGFKAYPNPVKDILNLSYTKNISSVSIHNLLGQEVMTKTVNATESKVDMSNLSQGTYLVKVNVDGLVKTLKVVKQ